MADLSLEISDKKHETVVVPFHGRQVPFHIATIKVCHLISIIAVQE